MDLTEGSRVEAPVNAELERYVAPEQRDAYERMAELYNEATQVELLDLMTDITNRQSEMLSIQKWIIDRQQQALNVIARRTQQEQHLAQLESRLLISGAELEYRKARPHLPVTLADMDDWQGFLFMRWAAVAWRAEQGEWPDYLGLMVSMSLLCDDDPPDALVCAWIGKGIRAKAITTVLRRSDVEPEEWGDEGIL